MAEASITYCTVSDLETIQLGQRLGLVLKAGDVIALMGELGSGKTWFTKGVALGMGIGPDIVITSPSFSLVNEYEGRHTLFHMDAYRVEKVSDFLSAGLDEYFYQDGVVVMEWADRWPEILPDWKVKIEFTIVDKQTRRIDLSGQHPRVNEMLGDMERLSEQSIS
jgi:tRNA threonylcarbamoyladenosine biosynthesis protein TsaE